MDAWKNLAEEFAVFSLLEEKSYLLALEKLLPSLYGDDSSKRQKAKTLRDEIFTQLKKAMQTDLHPPKTRMKFGTSGWRGLLYEDFTERNVACVTQALCDVLFDKAYHTHLGVKDIDDLQKRGCVLAHDTRLMGPEFVEVAGRVLLAHGVRLYDIGMATTPEVSTAIFELDAAFSINFTPSHNPFTYHGYKFNPADGGPATKELTAPVAERANQIFSQNLSYKSVSKEEWKTATKDSTKYQKQDPILLYKQSLSKRLPWLNLSTLIETINTSDLDIFVDNGFGATRGKYERLLEGVSKEKLHIFHHQEDYLFGGKSREPSVENFQVLQEKMKSSKARLVVGFMNDGDGDRFVGGGRNDVLVMNKFGPLVVRFLSQELSVSGDVTRSVMTSHMADAAKARYLPNGEFHETAVGFQYMKPFIANSVNSWEESDGMSPKAWSRDKDGLLAALILTKMVLHYQKPVEEILEAAENELGSFYFERQKVAGNKQGDSLKEALNQRFRTLKTGDTISIEDKTLRIKDVITKDGTKILFENGWWFGVRPSGTEPVVRPYVETSTQSGASQEARDTANMWQKKIMNWLKKEITQVVG